MKFASRSGYETVRRPFWRTGPGLSLRGWFAVFAFAVCAAIGALFVVDTVHDRNVAVIVAGRSARNLAESLAQQASETFESADGALATLVQRVEHDGVGPAARLRLHDTMSALVATTPRIHNLTIVDERGRSIVTTFPAAAISRLSFLNRPYFRFHRSNARAGISISGPAVNRFDKAPVLFATRRIDHRDGSFAGVVIAPISLDYFQRSYSSVDVGHSGSITLFAQHGHVLFRKPRLLGGRTSVDSGFLRSPYDEEPAGSYVRPSHVDGVLRLFAFRRLGRYPLVVCVALAQNEYLADWQTNAVRKAIAVALIISMIGGLAVTLSAQMGRRKRAEETLAQLALCDGLTGLANRRQFDAALEREWRHAARDQTPLALLMIDVDNFKSYNDMYGHQQGDATLIAIAKAIAASIVRPGDLTARYGGEEFVVILPATDAANAVTVAERIRGAVAGLGIPHAGSPEGAASVSIGVAGAIPPHCGEGAALVQAADSALYVAKRTGRNRTSISPALPIAVAAAGTARGFSETSAPGATSYRT